MACVNKLSGSHFAIRFYADRQYRGVSCSDGIGPAVVLVALLESSVNRTHPHPDPFRIKQGFACSQVVSQ